MSSFSGYLWDCDTGFRYREEGKLIILILRTLNAVLNGLIAGVKVLDRALSYITPHSVKDVIHTYFSIASLFPPHSPRPSLATIVHHPLQLTRILIDFFLCYHRVLSDSTSISVEYCT